MMRRHDFDCFYWDYDSSVDMGDCQKDYDECNPDTCLDYCDRQTAKDDAKLQFAPEGSN